MEIWIGICGLVLLAVIAVVLLRRRRKRLSKRERQELEQQQREKMLDRTLMNPMHGTAPAAVLYTGGMQYEKSPVQAYDTVLRITQLGQDDANTYLFPAAQPLFIASDHGQPVILQTPDSHFAIGCEIFSTRGGVYARAFNGTAVRLRRGRKATMLDSVGVRLRDSDRLELAYGIFCIEFRIDKGA